MKYFLILLLIPLTSIANASWKGVNKIDDFTDKKVSYAVYNDKYHRIQISIQANNSSQKNNVWMFLTRKNLGTFKPYGVIELRVDKNETYTIDPKFLKKLEDVGLKAYQWEPDTIGFLLWHGDEKKGCGYIEQLLSGNQLKGRYWLNNLERDSFSISLSGSTKAIIKGLELKICGK